MLCNILLIALFLPVLSVHASNSLSQEIVSKLSAQGFNCSNVPPAKNIGYRCRGTMSEGYPLPVNIFIPYIFSGGNKTNLALHLHGWNNRSGKPEEHFHGPQGQFGLFLTRAGLNTILVVPESEDKCVTYIANLSTTAGFDKFFDSVTSLLATCGFGERGRVDSLLISSHSGAYRSLAALADSEHSQSSKYIDSIKAMAFYDSIYGGIEQISWWAKKMQSSGGRFTVYFSTQYPASQHRLGGTVAQTTELAKILDARIFGAPNTVENLPAGIQFFGFIEDHYLILTEDRLTQHWRSIPEGTMCGPFFTYRN